MKDTEDETVRAGALTADMVAEFLRRHPDFFDRHHELLAELQIPHASGAAVSLVQRQVAVLREQNEQSRKRLRELIDIARRNEELATRMHLLALQLMDAAEPRDIFATLYENLRRNFNAERVSVRLFAEPAFVDSCAGDEFAGSTAKELVLFKSIIEKRKPLSGKLKRQQQVCLFGDGADDIKSAVMIPLQGRGWGGILAIGSSNPERFHEGLGVELLRNLGEMLSLIVKPWVKET
ncbi:MAG: DUF484 family protein [Gammaproteobacteria bacterium]|nr:DUF484 family protein [Gammaproteobacteria bacterium]